jgi:hypothetical protein
MNNSGLIKLGRKQPTSTSFIQQPLKPVVPPDYRCEFDVPKFYDLNSTDDDFARFSTIMR